MSFKTNKGLIILCVLYLSCRITKLYIQFCCRPLRSFCILKYLFNHTMSNRWLVFITTGGTGWTVGRILRVCRKRSGVRRNYQLRYLAGISVGEIQLLNHWNVLTSVVHGAWIKKTISNIAVDSTILSVSCLSEYCVMILQLTSVNRTLREGILVINIGHHSSLSI